MSEELTPAETELLRAFSANPGFDFPAVNQLKRHLAARLGPQAGFARWRSLIPREAFPDAERVGEKPLRPLVDAARHSSAFIEIAPGGRPFEIRPPRVIGVGDHEIIRHASRSQVLTCLGDVRARAASSVVDTEGQAVLDFEGDELMSANELMDYDPSIFSGDAVALRAWIVAPDGRHNEPTLDEAYSLFGANDIHFGHWLHEFLPKYVAASMTGCLPPVPVLIDAAMPPPHRQALELVLPAGVAIIERPRFSTMRVRNLWLSAAPCYPTLLPQRIDWQLLSHDPVTFMPVLAEMVRRIDRGLPRQGGPDKVYLARHTQRHRSLVNAAAIEAIARDAGFVIAYPEDLSFVEQVRLVRDARFVAGPLGSALYLCLFSRPGTKVCVLNHTHTRGLSVAFTGMFDAIGLDVVVVTGPIVEENENYLYFSNYEIDAKRFSAILDDWPGGGPESVGR